MKISKSKQELARIISESGGWRDGAESAAQCKSDNAVSFYRDIPDRDGDCWWGEHLDGCDIGQDRLIANWHQTILSRAEYFHLYPVTDDDGWIEWSGRECPVDKDARIDIRMTGGTTHYDTDTHWGWNAVSFKITHYPLHKQSEPQFCESVMRSIPEPEINSKNIDITQVDDIDVVESKPAIEQLAADYRNAKDYAERKQQEADDAKADADEKLRVLEIAGEAHGLLVTPITSKQEPELAIADWRDLRAGDVISVSGKWWEPDSEYTVDENDGSRDAPIRVGGYWARIGECSLKFIRRP